MTDHPEAAPGSVRRAAVLGSPISHSLSPVLHRAAYAALGLSWTYEAVEVDAESLAAFVGSRGPEWVGLSLTMPLKTAVLPLLTQRSSSAVLTECANTVLFTTDGVVGTNTDVAGIVEAFREHADARLATAQTATVLGGGATARSALAALDGLDVRDVTVVVRRPDGADALRLLAEATGLSLRVQDWSAASHHLDADVVVSTVPAGVADELVPVLPAVVGGALLDAAYDPWPSPLVTGWRGAGGLVVPGHAMLLHQAARQVELMTGHPAPLRAMADALAAAGR